MKERNIFWEGLKHILTPLTFFSGGSTPPTPRINALQQLPKDESYFVTDLVLPARSYRIAEITIRRHFANMVWR